MHILPQIAMYNVGKVLWYAPVWVMAVAVISSVRACGTRPALLAVLYTAHIDQIRHLHAIYCASRADCCRQPPHYLLYTAQL